MAVKGNLRFDSLELTNFKSFRGHHTINLLKYGAGLHFVTGINKVNPELGANGAGKTSVWDGLYWILYGRSIRGRLSPTLHTWGVDGETNGMLHLEKDGVAYIVTRCWHPNSLSIRQGEDIRMVEQPDVDALIGLDANAFLYTILVGQGNPLFMDLAPSAKLDVFEKLLNLTYWTDRSDIAKREYNRLEVRISDFNNEIHTHREAIKDLKIARQGESKRVKEQRQKLGERLAEQKQVIRTVARELGETDDEMVRIGKIGDKLKKKIDVVLDRMEHQNRRLEKFSRKLQARLHERNVAAVQVDHMKDQITRLLETSKNKCPTCGQKWSIKHRDEQVKRIRAEMKSYGRVIKRYDIAVSSLDGKTDQVHLKLKMLKRTHNDLSKRLLKWMGKKKEIESRIRELNITQKNAHDIMTTIKIDRQQLKAAVELAGEQIRKRRDAIKDAKSKRSDLERSAIATEFWIKGFRNIRLLLIDRITAEFSASVTQEAEALGLVGWELEVVVEKENKSGTIQRGLQVLIKGPHGEEAVPFEAYSGGEGQRLRLAVTFGLSDVILHYAGIVPGLEILDEPTRGINPQGVENLLLLLHERSHETGKQIWFVDQHGLDQGLFDKVMTVRKTKEGSFVV